jgi:hypothetical protein
MMQKELLTKKDYAAIGEEISHELAFDFIKSYAEAYPTDISAFYMGRNILEQILAQPGCTGIRFYNGINEKGQKTLVYIGIDDAGNDIIKRTVVQTDGSVVAMNGIVADRNANGTGSSSGGFNILDPSTWFGA